MVIKKLVIRSIVDADLGAVVAVEQECYPRPWTLSQFQQELDNPVATILVAEVVGEVVGYICYWLIAGEMQVLNIATAPQARRNGIAAQLLDCALNKSRSLGELSAVWLEVRAGNRGAIALYQRYGFVFNGTRKKYYRDGEDALLMVKTNMSQ